MKLAIKKPAKVLLNQLKHKHWHNPIYQLVLSANGGMIFGRYNIDGSFEHLLEKEPGYFEVPVVIRLIDAQGESIKGVVTKDEYEFSEN